MENSLRPWVSWSFCKTTIIRQLRRWNIYIYIYIYIYVCVCVCICVCIYIYIHTHIYTHTYEYLYTYMYYIYKIVCDPGFHLVFAKQQLSGS